VSELAYDRFSGLDSLQNILTTADTRAFEDTTVVIESDKAYQYALDKMKSDLLDPLEMSLGDFLWTLACTFEGDAGRKRQVMNKLDTMEFHIPCHNEFSEFLPWQGAEQYQITEDPSFIPPMKKFQKLPYELATIESRGGMNETLTICGSASRWRFDRASVLKICSAVTNVLRYRPLNQ